MTTYRSLIEEVLTDIKPSKARGRNIYLLDEVYLPFKAICETEGVPASAMIEKLMKDFLESAYEESKP